MSGAPLDGPEHDGTPAAAFYTYIVASGRNGTIYIGSTDDLARRVQEHRFHALGGFTAKYDCRHLVWYETHEAAFTANAVLRSGAAAGSSC